MRKPKAKSQKPSRALSLCHEEGLHFTAEECDAPKPQGRFRDSAVDSN
jgi:hypothetical protein